MSGELPWDEDPAAGDVMHLNSPAQFNKFFKTEKEQETHKLNKIFLKESPNLFVKISFVSRFPGILLLTKLTFENTKIKQLRLFTKQPSDFCFIHTKKSTVHAQCTCCVNNIFLCTYYVVTYARSNGAHLVYRVGFSPCSMLPGAATASG